MANQPRRDNPARTVRVDEELWTARRQQSVKVQTH